MCQVPAPPIEKPISTMRLGSMGYRWATDSMASSTSTSAVDFQPMQLRPKGCSTMASSGCTWPLLRCARPGIADRPACRCGRAARHTAERAARGPSRRESPGRRAAPSRRCASDNRARRAARRGPRGRSERSSLSRVSAVASNWRAAATSCGRVNSDSSRAKRTALSKTSTSVSSGSCTGVAASVSHCWRAACSFASCWESSWRSAGSIAMPCGGK